MSITIKDVARVAGVSKATVSRVLNGSENVSKATKNRVLKVIEELNYQPNFMARGLVKQKSYSIAIIVPDIRNPFFAQMCWKAERTMSQYGYSAVICSTNNQTSEEEVYLRNMKERRVDGVLIASAIGDATNIIDFKVREGIKVLLFDVDVRGYEIPTVIVDDIYGGHKMTKYLIELGHRRIAFATSNVTYAERQRLLGYKMALSDVGFPINEDMIIVNDESNWNSGRCDDLVLLMRSEQRPTAIFCSNDLKAFRACEILRNNGVEVPTHVSIAGYDNLELGEIMSPPLTTMAQPIDQMVESGISMLIAELNGEKIERPKKKYRPMLVERESCKPLTIL